MEINHPQLGKFQIINEIGRGSFATVYLAQHTLLHYPIALKVIHSNEEESIKSFKNTNSIVHPYVCQNFDLIKTVNGNLCIFMEYVNGKTLLDYANDLGHLHEYEIKKIFGQMVTAIEFLHKKKIIHRDLKCENVMIDQNRNIRLIDLSFSCPYSDEHSTLCGSPAYIAPEIIENKLYDDSIDIWSLGIIIYAITFGKLPFENRNYSMLFKMITTIEPDFVQKNTRLSDDLIDLIKKMLIKKPENRIKIDEIKRHPFFGTFFETNNSFDDESIKFPKLEILQQMNLSRSESIKVVDEIKSGQITKNTMTYDILFKIMISNRPCQNKKVTKDRSEGDLPILFEDHLQIEKKRVRFSDLSSFSSYPSLHNEYLTHFQPKKQQSQHKIFINNHVQFRRFSSMNKQIESLGNKKIILCSKNHKNNLANNHVLEEKLNMLSHLQHTDTFEEFN